MKIITMYELLGMVKDGKASDITTNFMFNRKKYNLLAFLDEYTLDINSLNWKIEILEEEKKIPEKLTHKEERWHDPKDENPISINVRYFYDKEEIGDKINEIIDYLKNKGE